MYCVYLKISPSFPGGSGRRNPREKLKQGNKRNIEKLQYHRRKRKDRDNMEMEEETEEEGRQRECL
jgi:hypothetical protein